MFKLDTDDKNIVVKDLDTGMELQTEVFENLRLDKNHDYVAYSLLSIKGLEM